MPFEAGAGAWEVRLAMWSLGLFMAAHSDHCNDTQCHIELAAPAVIEPVSGRVARRCL